MQENEFEKQLKQAMDDFRIVPSDSVWDKVKDRLREKKRRIIPIFFLLAAGLLAGGYFIYRASETNHYATPVFTNNQKQNISKADTIALQKLSGRTEQQVDTNANNNSNDSLIAGQKERLPYNRDLYSKEKVVRPTDNNVVINEQVPPQTSNAFKHGKETTDNIKRESRNAGSNENETSNIESTKQVNLQTITNKNLPESYDSSAADLQQTQNNNASTNSDLTKNNADVATNNNQASKIKTTSKRPLLTNKTPRWKFGFNVFYGKDKLIENAGSHNNVYPQYLNSNINTPQSLVTSGSKDQPFSSSDAYSFGAVVERRVFKNAYVSIGLNYTHFSAKASVDKKIDSSLVIQTSNSINSFYAINGYYQSGSSKTYSSKYNFIEVPVTFQQSFFNSKQTSLSYNAGFSVRRMLSSNTLIYNSDNNIYFSNNNFFRKTQFQFLAGVNAEINTGKNSSVVIGPQITYSLSNLAKNSSYGNFHFISYGLQAGFLFHKK